jgi:hypothetical protein
MGDILHKSDGDPNLLSANRNDDGRWLDTYYGKLDNSWNRDNGFAFAVSLLSSFSLSFFERVLFYYLPLPTTEHFSDFIQF